MPRTALTVHKITEANAAPSAGAAADAVNGNVVRNTGNTFLVIENGDDEASHAFDILIAKTVAGQSVEPITVTVPASTTYWRKLGDPTVFGGQTELVATSAELLFTAYDLV